MPTILTPSEPFVMPVNRSRIIRDGGGNPFDIARLFDDMPYIVSVMQQARFIRAGKPDPESGGELIASENSGWSFMRPIKMIDGEFDLDGLDLNDLDVYSWYTDGFGPDTLLQRQLCANGARKMLGLMISLYDEAFTDTLIMQCSKDAATSDEEALEAFPGPWVESVEHDGNTLWGVFPWGGAVGVAVGQWLVINGLSGYTGPQDHMVATLMATRLAEFLNGSGIDEIVELPPAA